MTTDMFLDECDHDGATYQDDEISSPWGLIVVTRWWCHDCGESGADR